MAAGRSVLLLLLVTVVAMALSGHECAMTAPAKDAAALHVKIRVYHHPSTETTTGVVGNEDTTTWPTETPAAKKTRHGRLDDYNTPSPRPTRTYVPRPTRPQPRGGSRKSDPQSTIAITVPAPTTPSTPPAASTFEVETTPELTPLKRLTLADLDYEDDTAAGSTYVIVISVLAAIMVLTVIFRSPRARQRLRRGLH